MRLGLRRHFCFPRPALRLLVLFPSFSLNSWDGVGQQRVLPSECVTVTSSLWFFHVFFCERISTSLADYAPRIDCGPTLSQRVLLRNSLWLSKCIITHFEDLKNKSRRKHYFRPTYPRKSDTNQPPPVISTALSTGPRGPPWGPAALARPGKARVMSASIMQRPVALRRESALCAERIMVL